MDNYSQEEWYQVFDEEYERYNSDHTDQPLEILEDLDHDFGFSVSVRAEAEFEYHDYHSPESVNYRRASLWDDSWASESPQSEALVMQAQGLIAVLWNLVDVRKVRIHLGEPGAFRCCNAGLGCNRGRGWVGHPCRTCGREIVEEFFTARELDEWFAGVIESGLSQTQLTRYLNKSFRIGLRRREARPLARQCFDSPGYGPLGLARIL